MHLPSKALLCSLIVHMAPPPVRKVVLAVRSVSLLFRSQPSGFLVVRSMIKRPMQVLVHTIYKFSCSAGNNAIEV
ncbi:hypothetical protein CC78DRAFT_532962 [Lojkania enalia]|uniref:Uncharacterized protein n=1 Tax=Lojkania enalia TaxID=147567 RepID=A0A9P4N4J8_9PLEO|nr:hypothetical protein CC78DRAFT_532962 [Didymosphaeria enalia]